MKTSPYTITSQARKLINRGQTVEAESMLCEARAQHPNDRHIQATLIDLYVRTGETHKAEELLTENLARHPDDPFFLTRKGDLLTVQHSYAEALELFTSLYYAGADPQIGWRLARLLFRTKKFPEAEQYYDRVAPALYDKAAFFFLGCRIKAALEKYEAAVTCIDRAIQLSDSPDFYEAQKVKLLSSIRGVTADQRARSLRYAKSHSGPHHLKELAESYLKEDNYAQAETYFLKALAVDNNPFVRSRLANCYYHWGKHDLALTIFLDSPRTSCFSRGFLKMLETSACATGEQQRVIDHLTQVLAENPSARHLWGVINRLKKNLRKDDPA